MLKEIIGQLGVKAYNWFYKIQPIDETIMPQCYISQEDNCWNKLALLPRKKPNWETRYTESQLSEYKNLLWNLWIQSSNNPNEPEIEEPKRLRELELIIKSTY